MRLQFLAAQGAARHGSAIRCSPNPNTPRSPLASLRHHHRSAPGSFLQHGGRCWRPAQGEEPAPTRRGWHRAPQNLCTGSSAFVSFSIPVFVFRFTMLDRSLFCFVLDVDCGGMRVRVDSRLQLRCIGLLFARDYVFDVAASYDWKAHSNWAVRRVHCLVLVRSA